MKSRFHLVCSANPQVTHADRVYAGVRCNCSAAHFFFALPLAHDELISYSTWSLSPRGGRRVRGDIFVSNSCLLPGTSIRLRLDHGPQLLSTAIAEWILGGGRGPAPAGRVSLPANCKRVIVSELLRLADAARGNQPMVPFYRAMMHPLLWTWTADAYDTRNDEIVRDGFKYDFAQLRHTEEAHARFVERNSSSGLIHEHAVPRRVLVEHFCAHDLNESSAASLLESECFAVIVTAEQDSNELGGELRSNMPPGWESGASGNALARYSDLTVHQPGECRYCTRTVVT